MVRAMRPAALLAFALPAVLSSPVSAQTEPAWSPAPTLFDYAAVFATCQAEPEAPDLPDTCADLITSAYVLNRAVARAAHACGARSLDTCATPFEDEGLPAIAVQIAAATGCDDTDPALLPWDKPLPADHCVQLAAHIMLDEGVTPLDDTVTCDGTGTECDQLARLHARLWADHLRTTVPDRNRDTIDRMIAETPAVCASQSDARRWNADGVMCEARVLARIWQDHWSAEHHDD